ncbi:Hypothetical predicted protein [Mytilus galloprovincialis]|uniref:C2H2-type domain-containing protein n=2 Tax=Mytilus galloprovincialis TaxID=29158 RepID=A0A8B6BRX0_MYTGA|nr:Hypothetical predicted protein [Mytilus galloprovincialis]
MFVLVDPKLINLGLEALKTPEQVYHCTTGVCTTHTSSRDSLSYYSDDTLGMRNINAAKGKDKDNATCPSKVTSPLDENFTCLSEESLKGLNSNTVFMTSTVNGQMFVKTNSKISKNQPDKNVSSKSVSEEKFDHFTSCESTENANFSEVFDIKQEPENYIEPDIKMSESIQNKDLPIFYEIKVEPNDDERSVIESPESANIQRKLFSTENKGKNTKKLLLGNVKSTLNHEEKAKRINILPDSVKQNAGKLMSKDVTIDQEETSIGFEIKGSELGEDGKNQQLEMVGIQDDMVIEEEQKNLDSKITRTFVKTTRPRSKKDNTRYLCQHCNYITQDKSNYNKHTSQHKDKTYMYIAPNKNTNWNKAQSIMGPKINESIKKSPTKVERLAKNSSDQVLPAKQPKWQISCAECGKTFRSKYGHTLHIKNKHNMDFKYLCSVCGQGFNQAIQYSHHCRRHQHQIKVDTCPLCKTEFMGLGSLKRHLETCNKSGSIPIIVIFVVQALVQKQNFRNIIKGNMKQPDILVGYVIKNSTGDQA